MLPTDVQRALALSMFLAVIGCGSTPAADAGPDGSPDSGRCMRDIDCDDGLFCDGTERCTNGSCVAGPLTLCNDHLACTVDGCSEDRRACVYRVPDADHDGHGARTCVDAHGTPLGDDCDDTDANRFPGNREICDPLHHDEDCDPTTHGGVDADADGYEDARCCNASACGNDCNDGNASAHPGATEVCNTIDDDCDAMIDEGVTTAVYVDADHDGHGASGSAVLHRCATSGGYSVDATDCLDSDFTVSPGNPELCDHIDNDCDTVIDEDTQIVAWYRDVDGDGFGSAASGITSSCTRPTGYSRARSDCDDTTPARSPAAPELCNAIYDDCNGVADYVIAPGNLEDDDRDHIADSMCGAPLGRDCDDLDPNAGPGMPETCNGRDDDCDGIVDENAAQTAYYVDADHDGWGASRGAVVVSCLAPRGAVARGGDCDDSNPAVAPGNSEACNGTDDDCDGSIDEGEAQASCRSAHSVAGCIAGRCQVVSCVAPYANCDTNPDCEANLQSGATCGSCGNACPRPGSFCGLFNACVPNDFTWAASIDSAGPDDMAQVIASPIAGNFITGGGHGLPMWVNGLGVVGVAAPLGGLDGWVAEFTGTGGLVWFRHLGSGGNDWVDAVAPDPMSGNRFYAAGYYQGAPNFVALGAAGTSGFVVRLNTADGSNASPALAFTSNAGTARIVAMRADTNGITVAGSYTADVNIPNGPGMTGSSLAAAVGPADGFIARFALNQTLRWVRSVGGNGTDQIFALDVDAAGNTYALVYTNSSSLTAGARSAPSIGLYDVAVVALDASGLVSWVTRLGSLTDDSPGQVAVVGNRVVFTGSIGPNATLGIGAPIAGHGGSDASVVALDTATGSTVWANTYGGTLDDGGVALTVARGRLYVGLSNGSPSLAVGGVNYTAGATVQALVISLTSDGDVRWSRGYGGPSDEYPVGLDYLGGTQLLVRTSFSNTFGFFSAPALSGFLSDVALSDFDIGIDG